MRMKLGKTTSRGGGHSCASPVEKRAGHTMGPVNRRCGARGDPGRPASEPDVRPRKLRTNTRGMTITVIRSPDDPPQSNPLPRARLAAVPLRF
ncbi:uncharacterized protein LOC124411574 isoform X2 [Diprion similis]|uniref:uncharacterized protein LOC124411574 isoform X2 n=1 Tax=Diprion similis TaxID=362088 RepID=UPI001EF86009|nr:uncharacterized protein LOC124411574 isoform X2 [Diprion similis]